MRFAGDSSGTLFAHLLSEPIAQERQLTMTVLVKYLLVMFLLLLALPLGACFGPKLYVGTAAGVDGELLYHLVTLYVQEKTGVESIRVEMTADQTAEQLLRQEKVDLVFSAAAGEPWPSLLTISEELYLLTGARPTDDLQFTTVPKALSRLQALLQATDLPLLRQQVAAGVLPAKAVRTLYRQRGWL